MFINFPRKSFFQWHFAQIILLQNTSESVIFRYFHTLSSQIRNNLIFLDYASLFLTTLYFISEKNMQRNMWNKLNRNTCKLVMHLQNQKKKKGLKLLFLLIIFQFNFVLKNAELMTFILETLTRFLRQWNTFVSFETSCVGWFAWQICWNISKNRNIWQRFLEK